MKYYTPSSLSELNDLFLQINESKISILSGGTDILPRWEEGITLPKHLIDLKKINSISGIVEHDDKIIIGALTTVQDIYKSELIKTKYTALHQAASQFAGVQIRHRATIGGNICNASPAGDLLPGLYVHNAMIEITESKGTRILPINEFIIGVGKTALKNNEIVSAIIFEKSEKLSIFYKLGLRQSMAISVVNFAISYRQTSQNRFDLPSIAVGAVAPTVVYLKEFTKAVNEGLSLEKTISLIEHDISPIDDIRASAEYRRTVLRNMIQHFVRHELIEPKLNVSVKQLAKVDQHETYK